jgi:UDP-glucose 4-epimerase
MAALINEPRAAGEVFNIGNGEEISIRDLATRVCERTGSRSELRYVPYEQAFDRSFEDMPRRVPDISKLRRLVGYEPRIHLNAIIDSVITYWSVQQSGTERVARLRERRPERVVRSVPALALQG